MHKMKESRRAMLLLSGVAMLAIFAPAPGGIHWLGAVGLLLIYAAVVGRTTIQDFDV